MKNKLSFEDFRLANYENHRFYYIYKWLCLTEVGPNWPFHDTRKEKNEFIISTGLLNGIYNGSFPEFDTKDKATMLLILAIADYNSRHEEV